MVRSFLFKTSGLANGAYQLYKYCECVLYNTVYNVFGHQFKASILNLMQAGLSQANGGLCKDRLVIRQITHSPCVMYVYISVITNMMIIDK